MIFTADLDRTLLFSRRHLTETPAVIPAEYRMGEPYGFMTPGALDALRQIQGRYVCLINTLRGLEQTRRVCFAADGSCRYLALQNGLYLYRDGAPDRAWQAHVAGLVSSLPLDLSRCARRVLEELPGIECLSKQYEYMAVFFVDEARFDGASCTQLAQELDQAGWSLYRQRRKLYLWPGGVDKGAVLRRVQALEDGAPAVGFGDSWFDLPMLRACQRAYSLRGCELDGFRYGFPLQFSKSPAQAGTEEILWTISKERLEN